MKQCLKIETPKANKSDHNSLIKTIKKPGNKSLSKNQYIHIVLHLIPMKLSYLNRYSLRL